MAAILKGGQCKFAKLIVPTNAKSHSGIKEIMQLKSILLASQHGDFLVKEHVLVHQQFRCLINDDYNECKDKVSVCFHLISCPL